METRVNGSDERRTDYWIGDNKYFDAGYGAVCGDSATAVYFAIVRHFNQKKGVAYPGIKVIAREAGVSEATVKRSWPILESLNLIKVIKTRSSRNKQWMRNNYKLVNRSQWIDLGLPKDWKKLPDTEYKKALKIAKGRSSYSTPSTALPELYPMRAHSELSTKHYNKTNWEEDTILIGESDDSPTLSYGQIPPEKEKKVIELDDYGYDDRNTDYDISESLVNRAVKEFQVLNKNWQSFYEPGPERQSIKKLIRFVIEDGISLTEMIQMAKDCQGEDFEPQIYTPTDLVNKYDRLKRYY